MSEENKPKYTIKESVVNGAMMKCVVTEQGGSVFAVSTSFTDEQIEEVYNLCDNMFAKGFDIGKARVQMGLRQMLGIVDHTPTAPQEVALDQEEEVSNEAVDSIEG